MQVTKGTFLPSSLSWHHAPKIMHQDFPTFLYYGNVFVVKDAHKNLMVLNRFYVPRFGDLEWNYACQVNVEHTVCCVCGYHAAVGELLACEREQKNSVGAYCGSEDR